MPSLAATCIPTHAISCLEGSILNKEYFLLPFSLEQRSGTLCRARKELFMLSTETTNDRSVIISLVGQDGASNMADQVPQAVKEERHGRLPCLVNEIGARRYARLVGEKVEILVEGPSKRPERWMGRTRCNKIVVIDGSERHRAALLTVRITRSGSFTLYGDPAILNEE